ncbi:hypothetical protein Godav_008802 [Gossypium davidsonii]|uniref:Enoyl reductase (ER) domain-containing protein n=1 Tax=Gossypium davidsonii TaxID=34287 RepID=A0A7J8SB75_GOSDV|nr:hypothetical protein [Gossypium davidsonii]
MKAIVITTGGGPEVLQLQQVEDPELKDDEVLIKVEATALNRADTLQRKGSYPPPKGASPYPGLECSGTIQAVGKNVLGWRVGDQVCALLSGGGYAEKVAVPAGQVLPIPLGVSLKEAAGLPEVACTVWSTVFMMSRLSARETFLVHGGSSGIGTFAIQIAKSKGATVFATAGNEEKLAFCKSLGADLCINYKTEDFVACVKEETGGKGVDVILDCIGAAYLQRNLDSLNFDGRLCIIGLQGGAVTEIKLNTLFPKRLTVQGSSQHEEHITEHYIVYKYSQATYISTDAPTSHQAFAFPKLKHSHILKTAAKNRYSFRAALRPRNPENKAMVVNEVEKNVWPEIVAGKVKPIIYKSFPLSEAGEAHKLMESNEHIGKILLVP